MRKWLLATLAAVAMAAGLVAYQPAPQQAQAAPYCTMVPNVPVLYQLQTLYGFVDWECTQKPYGMFLSAQLQYKASDGSWVNYGNPYTTTIPARYGTYADTAGCSYDPEFSRAWRTRAHSDVWFTSGGYVAHATYYSNSKSFHC